MQRLLIDLFHGMQFGDWVMVTSFLKMVNLQYPHIQINFSVHSAGGPKLIQLPMVCGVNMAVTDNNNPDDYNFRACDFYYDLRPVKETEHCRESMINIINATSENISFKYQPEVLAKVILTIPIEVPTRPYILMSSVGRMWRDRHGDGGFDKEYDGMQELATILSRYYSVVDIGTGDTPRLNSAEYSYRDIPFPQLGYLFQHAKFGVFIENGLSHFAGHQGTDCFTLFRSKTKARPGNVWYPGQTAIEIDSMLTVPGWIADRVLEKESLK